MVRIGHDARKTKHRVRVLADDLRADLRMLSHDLPFRVVQLGGLANNLGRDRQLADVVERRCFDHHFGHLGLRLRGLADEMDVLAHAQRLIPVRGALVMFDYTRQPLHQLLIRSFELRGTLAHRLFQVAPPLGERMRIDPGEQELTIDGLGDVVHGTELQAHGLVADIGQRRKKDDWYVGGRGMLLQRLAHLVAIHTDHHDIEQNEVGLLRLLHHAQRSGTVARRADFEPL